VGGLRLLAKVLILRLLLILALCGQAIPNATARSWTGNGALVGGVFKLWSDPDNWSPQGVPQNGESLLFNNDSILSDSPPMINDLTNLTVSYLQFTCVDVFNTHWVLSGNTLGISSGMVNDWNYDCQVQINCGLKLAGNATFVTGSANGGPPPCLHARNGHAPHWPD
jgi:hypothetical protein